MDYSLLAKAYFELETSKKRLKKTKIISDLFKITPIEDIDKVTIMIKGNVFSQAEKIELGVSNKLLLKAISIVTGYDVLKLEDLWREKGDLGLVIENLYSSKKQATLFSDTLSVSDVFTTLRKIASLEGQGSTDQKVKLVSSLLSNASALESKYIIRTVLQDLKVGVAEGTLRDAIAWTYLIDPNYDEETQSISPDREEYNLVIDQVQFALDKTNDFALVARLANKGLSELNGVGVEFGKPIKVMLAQKSSVSESFKALGSPAAFEHKLDGFRMQIQKSFDDVKIFTRRLDDVTAQFPDVVEVIKKNVKSNFCILDCEAVGYNPSTFKYMPFQHISQRIRRKYDILRLVEELPVEVNVFDILYEGEKDLFQVPFSERRKILEKIIFEDKFKIVLIKQIVTDDLKDIDAFFKDALSKGYEGIMGKSLDSFYKPGSRVGSMVKIKPHMDELDLVIVKAEWGTGKRSGWLTSFTVACGDGEEYFEVGKVGTGLKEKSEEGLSFEEVTDLLKPLIISQVGRDVEVVPSVIVSLRFEEIQKSPSYSSGYALRFPRIVSLREDKSLEEITSLNELELAYKGQGV